MSRVRRVAVLRRLSYARMSHKKIKFLRMGMHGGIVERIYEKMRNASGRSVQFHEPLRYAGQTLVLFRLLSFCRLTIL